MHLYRLHLNLRCKEARRDVGDPYQMHATLCRAFSTPERKCDPGAYMWRLEPETNGNGEPRVLVQSGIQPVWDRIGVSGWLAKEPDPGIDLSVRLGLDRSGDDRRFRYRLRANPSVCRKGKRTGLFKRVEQEKWLARKGEQHGFNVVTCHISQEGMMTGRRNDGGLIRIYTVLFDGFLETKEPGLFRAAIAAGIGHGKAMGLGMLSAVPVS